MRLLLAASLALLASLPPAQAARARDGFGTSSRCHCDRYTNPHYLTRGRPAIIARAPRGSIYSRY